MSATTSVPLTAGSRPAVGTHTTALAGTHQPAKRKEFEGFADPNFNVRQWVNQSLSAVPATTTTATAASNTSPQLAYIASADAFASQLLSDLQVHTSDVSQQLEHSIGQALARLPRTAAEISRMAHDASGISKQLADIRTVVDPIVAPPSQQEATKEKEGGAEEGPDEEAATDGSGKSTSSKKKAMTQADVDRLQKSKEKLLWCRNVLRTAQTLSQDVNAIEKGLRALGNHTASNGAAAGPNSDGGIADIETLAASIRKLNVSLGTIKAVDPSFGTTHEAKIKSFELQLQQFVERECLDTIRGRQSSVPQTMDATEAKRIAAGLAAMDATLQRRLKLGGKNSPSSFAASVPAADYTVRTAWGTTKAELAQQNRANRLFAILRTIQRDGVAVETLIQTSVDRLTRFFGSAIAPALASAGPTNTAILPGLLRIFFKHMGAQIANDAAYLWSLADLGENATAASSAIVKASSAAEPTTGSGATNSAVVAGTSASAIRAGNANDGIDETINDATATIAQRTLEAIAVPLQKVFAELSKSSSSDAPNTASASSASSTDAATDFNIARVMCLEGARDAEREALSSLRDLVSTVLCRSSSSAGAATIVQTGTPTHPKSALKHLLAASTSSGNSAAITDASAISGALLLGSGAAGGGGSHTTAADTLFARLAKALPRAMHSTAGRQLFAPMIESFVLLEKQILSATAAATATPAGGGGGGFAMNTYPQLADADALVRKIEPCLHRCAGFFPTETAILCLNSWSRFATTAMHNLQAAIAKDLLAVSSASAPTSSSDEALVQRLIAAVKAAESLRSVLLHTQSECFASFIAAPSSSSDPSAAAAAAASVVVVVDTDILQSCMKVVEQSVRKAAANCQTALHRVLAGPVERLLRNKYRTMGEWRSIAAAASSSAAADDSSAAQRRTYTAGLTGPCDVVRDSCDLVMELPVSLEANGVADDDRAALFKAVVVEVLRMVLGEVCAGLGAAPASSTIPAAPNASKAPAAAAVSVVPGTANPTLVYSPSRLLVLPSHRAIAQLAADMEYLASIVDYCGIDEGGVVSGDDASSAHAPYTVDADEAKYEHPIEYWASADGHRCAAEYEKKLAFSAGAHTGGGSAVSKSSAAAGGGNNSNEDANTYYNIPSDLAELFGDETVVTPYTVFKRLQLHTASAQRAISDGTPAVEVPLKMVL